MFTGLPETERAAFFSLLDEYFQARPHLLPSGIQASYDPTVAHAQAPAPAGVTVNRQDLERAGQFAATPTGQKITGFAAGKVLGNKALGSYAASSWANHHNSNVTPAPGASSAAAPPPPARKGPPPPPSASSKPQVSGLQSGRVSRRMSCWTIGPGLGIPEYSMELLTDVSPLSPYPLSWDRPNDSRLAR